MAKAPGKRVAERTCVGCGGKQGKRQLMRVVRHPSGEVEVDPTGKAAGRGAYFCPSRECWLTGLKKNRLDYTLRTRLSSEAKERLTQFALSLPQ